MRALRNLIPDVEVLIALEPEELAAKLIFLLRRIAQMESRKMVHGGDLSNEFDNHASWEENTYPEQRIAEAKRAFFEAWAWLESQALLVWPDSSNGANGWRVLSRRALRFQNEDEFISFATAKQLRIETLHKSIAKPVWGAFTRGEFDVAVFLAMKAVEVAVRTRSGATSKELGVPLMRNAFNPERGKLTDITAEYSEREALSALFAGAIGLYKNPQSHRNVGISDAREAIEIIMLANHLLRIIDSRNDPETTFGGSAIPT